MKSEYKIPYRYVSKEEAEKEAIERRKDTTWHRCHSFEHGWFWCNYYHDIDIYWWHLTQRNIEFKDFPNLENSRILEIILEVKEENRKEKEWHRSHPIKVTFDKITMPKFRKEIGDMPNISDLCGVQPII